MFLFDPDNASSNTSREAPEGDWVSLGRRRAAQVRMSHGRMWHGRISTVLTGPTLFPPRMSESMDRSEPDGRGRPMRPPRPDEDDLAIPPGRLPGGVDPGSVCAARIQVLRDLRAAQKRLDELIAFSGGASPFALRTGKVTRSVPVGGALSPEEAERVDQALDRCLELARLLETPSHQVQRVQERLVREARLLLQGRST